MTPIMNSHILSNINEELMNEMDQLQAALYHQKKLLDDENDSASA